MRKQQNCLLIILIFAIIILTNSCNSPDSPTVFEFTPTKSTVLVETDDEILLASDTPIAPDSVVAVGPPTKTQTPSQTPTNTPTHSITPSATPILCPPKLTVIMNAFCREGPSQSYLQETAFEAGENLQVEGRNNDNSWWWVLIPNSSLHCWISDVTIEMEGESSCLSVITPPPTYTPIAPPPITATPTDTPIGPPPPPGATQPPSATPPDTPVVPPPPPATPTLTPTPN